MEAVSFQDLIGRQQAAGFVGREGPLAQFQANLAVPVGDPARRLVFFIHGDGGVGKTSLMMRLREIADGYGSLTAYLEESVFGVPDAMQAIAVDLARHGEPMKRFTRLFETYRQRRHEVETDRDLPPEVAGFLTSTAVRVGLHAARSVPGAGGLAEQIDPAALSEQADKFRKYLGTKFRRRQDVAILLSPAQELTPAFLEDLAAIGRRKPLALFFDTYERIGPILDEWLIALLAGGYGALPADLVITIAGRSSVDTERWAPYLVTLADTPLAPFTEVEARQFLAREQITDERVVEVMLAISGRLPLLLATLAKNRPRDPAQVGDPSGDAVERFLRWETDPQRRALAVASALPRSVNEDILRVLAGDGADGADLFAWLRAQPFITHLAGRCLYHEVVRAAMIRLARGQSPTRWRQQHHDLAEQRQAWRLAISEQDAWSDPVWREHRLEETYHRLCADGVRSLPDALSAIVQATSESEVPGPWAQMLTQAGIDTDTAAVRQWGEQLESALLADNAEVGFFNLLAGSADLPAPAHAEALRCRGIALRGLDRYDEALADFDLVIELDPTNGLATSGRGETYRLMGRFAEALADFDRAIGLDSSDAWDFGSRGETYRLMGRFDEALADFDRAIELEPAYGWAIGNRGQTYQAMGRFDEALADFGRAIELDPAYGWAISNRGETYQAMGRFDEALADFGRAIELDPAYGWAIVCRGRAYETMGRFDEALADFGRAIELDPAYGWAISNRGETYQAMGRFDEALADFDRAIELDPAYGWAIGSRGETYQAMGRFDEALADFDRAIELDPADALTIGSRGEVYQLMGRFDEALADFDRAIELDPAYGWAIGSRGVTYRLMGRFDEALADFDRAIELRPTDSWCQYQGALVQLARGETSAAATRIGHAIELVQDSLMRSNSLGDDDINIITYHAARNDPEASQLLANLLAKGPSAVLILECLNDLRALAEVINSALVRGLVARLEAF